MMFPFKKKPEVSEHQKEIEATWLDRFDVPEKAVDTYYSYHSTGFPVDFPYWMNLDQFVKWSLNFEKRADQ